MSRGGRASVLVGLLGIALLVAPSPASAQTWDCSGAAPMLTVIVAPGSGSVRASDPNGCITPPSPTCTASCAWTVQSFCEVHCQHRHTGPTPTTVTLEANPAPGLFFAGLTGCERGLSHAVNQCAVTVNGPKTVRAMFREGEDTHGPSVAPVLTGTAGAYDVTLSWTPAQDDVWLGGYTVHRNNRPLVRTPGGMHTLKLTNLQCDMQYVFRVEAFDAKDNIAPSNELVLRTGRCASGGGAAAPNTILHTKPPKVTRLRRASFHWGSNQQRVTYQCKLDRQPWRACRPGKTYRNLKKGVHTFRVRARNSAGKVDRTPAIWRWRIR